MLGQLGSVEIEASIRDALVALMSWKCPMLHPVLIGYSGLKYLSTDLWPDNPSA